MDIILITLRAKEIKEKSSSNEVIGCAEENESDFNGDSDAEDILDSVATPKLLTTTNFSDTKCQKITRRK